MNFDWFTEFSYFLRAEQFFGLKGRKCTVLETLGELPGTFSPDKGKINPWKKGKGRKRKHQTGTGGRQLENVEDRSLVTRLRGEKPVVPAGNYSGRVHVIYLSLEASLSLP